MLEARVDAATQHHDTVAEQRTESRRLGLLDLAVLDGRIVEVIVELDRLVCCRAVLILRAL